MLTKMMPELNIKNEPKDRTFFYNILITLNGGIAERMVYNAE